MTANKCVTFGLGNCRDVCYNKLTSPCNRTIRFEAEGKDIMVKNNVEIDIKTMCIEAGITQAKLANKLGVTPAYVNRVIRRKETVVNRTFTRLIEALGYDILITYVKQDPAALNNVEQKGVTF